MTDMITLLAGTPSAPRKQEQELLIQRRIYKGIHCDPILFLNPESCMQLTDSFILELLSLRLLIRRRILDAKTKIVCVYVACIVCTCAALDSESRGVHNRAMPDRCYSYHQREH